MAHGPDPWELPDWAHAKPDNTFGNRWDDPDGVYRVLYACSERLGTFMETLARFRPDPAVVAGLAAIDADDQDGPAALQPGQLPRSWLETRRLGEGYAEGSFADVGHSSTLAHLNASLAADLVRHGIKELDAAVVRLSSPRRLTQVISRRIFELTSGSGTRMFDGIAYLSRLGDEFQNWAIFEPLRLSRRLPQNLRAEDPDLAEAMKRLSLTLVDR